MIKFSIPKIIKREEVKIIMICNAPSKNKDDYFFSSKDSISVINTVNAFNYAGVKVKDINDIIKKGVYLTVAVKVPRESLTIPANLIKEHSHALENELNSFPNIKAILLMGDTAIKSLNFISQRTTGKKVIPSGATYKMRGEKFFYKDIRVFPSYLQTGKNFLIEKSKQRMVADDIKNAIKLIKN